MSTPQQKASWRTYVLKRAQKNKRLVSMATSRLQRDYQEPDEMPPQARLGIHLGLITLTNCSAKVQDIRARARWMLHWMLGYLLDQGFTVEDASTENALDALEALIIAAAQVRVESRDKQPPHLLQYKQNVLMYPDGTPVPNTWTDVYNTAWRFINGMDRIA